ncbi:MAG: hypothetical protein QM820_54870 [Minicystis sp.]
MRTRARRARIFAALVAVLAVRALVAAAPRARCDGAWARLDTVESCGACGVRCAAEHAAATCVEGKCVLACEPGHADCDGHPGNGCEADLQADRNHCGGCVRSCGGARCENGSCAARLMGNGATIAADEQAVYALGPPVVKYPLDGSEAVTVDADAGAPAHAADAEPRIADGSLVYWATRGPDGGAVVQRAPRGGGEAVTVVAHPFAIRDLAVNATHLFWVDEKQRIFMAPKKPR